MSNLVEHTTRELALMGMTEDDKNRTLVTSEAHA